MEDVHGKITNYGYDALNRRIAKTSGAATTEYLYDGLEVVNEVQEDGRTKLYNLAGGRIVSLSLGLQNGENANSPAENPSPKKLFYSYDGLGSVAGLSDAKQKGDAFIFQIGTATRLNMPTTPEAGLSARKTVWAMLPANATMVWANSSPSKNPMARLSVIPTTRETSWWPFPMQMAAPRNIPMI